MPTQVGQKPQEHAGKTPVDTYHRLMEEGSLKEYGTNLVLVTPDGVAASSPDALTLMRMSHSLCPGKSYFIGRADRSIFDDRRL